MNLADVASVDRCELADSSWRELEDAGLDSGASSVGRSLLPPGASGPARIVNISSDTYRVAKLDFDDLMLEDGYNLVRERPLEFDEETSWRLWEASLLLNKMEPPQFG